MKEYDQLEGKMSLKLKYFTPASLIVTTVLSELVPAIFDP